jgi:hypothetical protein
MMPPDIAPDPVSAQHLQRGRPFAARRLGLGLASRRHQVLKSLAVMLLLGGGTGCANAGEPAAPSPSGLPAFVPTVRAYGGMGHDDFQRRSLKELGLEYVQGLVDFTWDHLERGDNVWKWGPADEQMDRLAAAGLKVVPFLLCPKSPGLPWDPKVTRKDARFPEQYGEFAYQVAHRYRSHRAWSGLMAVSGGSADVWDRHYDLTDPEVVVPILNAAYDGIKRAHRETLVLGFNFATTAHRAAEWEEYHQRAFALRPKFDWYGVQSHMVPATWLEDPGAFTGVMGLVNVRRFFDRHGYADKPLWMSEAGYACGEDLGGLPERVHAEQVVQSYILGRVLPVRLKGWVYFEYFAKTRRFEDGADFGLMTALDESNPPKPRQAWQALQTLIKKARFFEHEFEAKVSGEPNETAPYVLRFRHPRKPAAQLWVVFSPWGRPKKEWVSREITLRIGPARQATIITMLGEEKAAVVDSAGDVRIVSTSSPAYLKVE